MKKFKNVKKIINSKLLYAFPLAGAGLFFTQQSAHAMFNPPRKQPAVQHFNSASSSSLSRPLTSTTSPRPSTGISPYKPTGSKVSSLVSRFETSSTSSQQNLPSKTASAQNLSTRTETKPTPNYNSLGARPKTNTSSSSLYSKNASDTGISEQLFKASFEFKEAIQNANSEILSSRLTYELKSKLNNKQIDIPVEENAVSLQKTISKISSDTFITETKKELYRRNIPINNETEEKINKHAFYFGSNIGNLSANKFREKVKIFNTANIDESIIPFYNNQIKTNSYDLGNVTGKVAAYELITSINEFINLHK